MSPPTIPPGTWTPHPAPDPAASFRCFVGERCDFGGQPEAKKAVAHQR